MKKILQLLLLLVMNNTWAGGHVHLDKAAVNINDLASLQRGARIFMNRCSSCHSLQYVRYNTMAYDLGIVDEDGELLTKAIEDNLLYSGNKITDNIQVAMAPRDAEKWFGVAPPDLSLVARSRGADWIYTYLRSFYADSTKAWGVDNKIFPNTAMPFVLEDLQQQLPAAEFDKLVLDLVNFLVYIGEPHQQIRKQIGLWVMLFLGIFTIFAYLLKREYWKDVN